VLNIYGQDTNKEYRALTDYCLLLKRKLNGKMPPLHPVLSSNEKARRWIQGRCYRETEEIGKS